MWEYICDWFCCTYVPNIVLDLIENYSMLKFDLLGIKGFETLENLHQSIFGNWLDLEKLDLELWKQRLENMLVKWSGLEILCKQNIWFVLFYLEIAIEQLKWKLWSHVHLLELVTMGDPWCYLYIHVICGMVGRDLSLFKFGGKSVSDGPAKGPGRSS